MTTLLQLSDTHIVAEGELVSGASGRSGDYRSRKSQV